MHTYAQRLMSERDHLSEMITSLGERAAAEDRDLTDTEQESIDGWDKRGAEIDAQLKRTNEQMESVRAYASLRSRLVDNDTAPPETPAKRNGGGLVVARTWGSEFVDSDQFRSYSAGSSARVTMPTGLLERAASDPIMTTDLPIQAATYEPPRPRFDLTPLLNAITREPVAVGSVEYYRFQPDIPDPAPEVPEGELKPPAEITLEEKAVALKTYAHWKAITRQALEDYPRIRNIVETYLRDGLYRAIELAVAEAINTDTDIDAVASPGGSLLAGIRMGMAQVQENGFTPNALLLNNQDWAQMDIGVTLLAAMVPALQGGFWGITPISSPEIDPGTAYVGDLRSAVTYFDRNVANVFVTDSHADFFLRNKLVILAETRGFPAVVAPAAVVKVEGDATVPLGTPDEG